MSGTKAGRYRVQALGFDFALTHYSRGHPRPGIAVELETPFMTLGGYIYG